MALFQARQEEKMEDKVVPEAQQQEAVRMAQQAPDFLADHSGEGYGDMGTNQLSISYLTVVQALSKAKEEGVPEGHFYCSALQKDYGTSIRVIVCAFKTCWVEKDSNGNTVNRYEPGDCEFTGNMQDGMISKNGYKLEEQWLYQLLNADALEDGYMVYTGGVGNMRFLRPWNARLFHTLLPNQKVAPIYSKVWEITTAEATGKKSGRKFYGFGGGIKDCGWVTESIFTSAITPAIANKEVLQIAAPQAEGIEE